METFNKAVVENIMLLLHHFIIFPCDIYSDAMGSDSDLLFPD